MKVFFYLFAVFFCQYAAAQSFNNRALFTTQNSLSNNNISCLEKDKDGFLWVGTNEGLNRYDGTEFINVLSNSKNNLPSNSIKKICSINKNTLAVATAGGLCFLNTRTLVGKAIVLQHNNLPVTNGFVFYDMLYDEKEKELWVGTKQGIYVLSDAGIVKRKMEVGRSENPNRIFAVYLFKDAFNKVFLFSRNPNGFFYPDFKSGKLLPFEQKFGGFALNNFAQKETYFLLSAAFADNKIFCSFSVKDGAKSRSVIAYYNNSTRQGFIDSIPTKLTSENFLFNAFSLNDSALLINSYFGEPWLYNVHTRKIKPAADYPLWFTSWPDGILAKLLVEKENIWVTTNKGLIQIPQQQNIFKSNTALTNVINANSDLVSFNAGIYHSGKFWLSCMGAGLYALDTNTNKIQQVFKKPVDLKFKSKVISNEIVDAGKDLWLFSVYGPVAVNTSTLKLNLISIPNRDSLFNDRASFPFTDTKKNTWISLPDGVAKFNTAAQLFTYYKNKKSGGPFPLERAFFKTEDGEGNLWFARQDSLVKLNPVTGSFSLFYLKKNGEPVRPVQGLASNGKDILYMYLNGALAFYHISSGAIDFFTKQTGIVSTNINQIVTDKNGDPWIATEGGLVYYSQQTQKFYSYTIADGLPDDNIISLNFTSDLKTELFVGFPKSYCLFDPEKLLAKKNATVKNMITGVEVNGQAIAFDEAITFPYKKNSISFFYTGINFTAGRQNSYAYMLEGFEKEWTFCGSKRQCNYINLPPGKYTFKIKTANQQGEWNDDAASFSFKILAPFWQTWWFRLIAVFCAMLLIYWFIKRRDDFKEKENKAALQMSELKLTALQSQMNPHFIFNSLNSIQNYILQQKPIDAARYLSKFSKLMRRILDQSFSTLTSLNEIVETLSMYMELEAFRFSNEFNWQIKVEDAESINDVKLPALLLQPYVENAIIHGLMPKEGEKNLLIHLYKKDKTLYCVVDDNGVGRGNKLTATDGHISRGQKLTDDMLATMKQLLHTDARIVITDKKDEQNNAAGTRVELIIPLNVV